MGFLGKYLRSEYLKNLLNLNLIYYSNTIVQILVIPILNRDYGLIIYGEYVFVLTVVNYLDIFVKFGFDYFLLRFSVENANSSRAISQFYFASVIARGVFFVVGLFSVGFLFFLFKKDYLIVYLFIYGTLLKSVLLPLWFYQSIDKLKIVSWSTLIGNILFLLQVFVITNENLSLVWYSFAVFNTSLLQIVIVLFDFNSRVVQKLDIIECMLRIRILIKESYINFLSSAVQLYTQLTKVFIGIFFPKEILAIYDLSSRIVNLITTPFVIFNNAVYPEVLRTKNVKWVFRRLVIQYVMIAVLVLAVMINKVAILSLLSGSDSNALIYVNKYSYVLPLIMMTIFAVISNQVLGFHILYNFGYDNIRAHGSIYASCFYAFVLILLYLSENVNLQLICILIVFTEFISTTYFIARIYQYRKSIFSIV